ncbi:MAG TPA: DUF2279 domain-containing protein [Acidobacteriota bacterium]|nr:DUF2279 domain-containing protein [Acidobacteriota bacterium]
MYVRRRRLALAAAALAVAVLGNPTAPRAGGAPIDGSILDRLRSRPALADRVLLEPGAGHDPVRLTGDWRGHPVSAPTGGLPDGSRIIRSRAALWGAFSIGALYMSYRQSQAVWGGSSGRFHFKDDLINDRMALTDEVSHLFMAFQFTEYLSGAHRWIGMEPDRARRIGAWEAWALTFLVEFPIDAFNPGQGFGVSDMLFNTAGVLAAHHRADREPPHRWDIKASVKRQFFEGESRLIAHTNKQYDDYIYWLTIRPSMNRFMPLLLGVGYSTSHDDRPNIIKEVHFGIGTSLEEIGGMFGERTARYLRPLNFFFVNVGTKISWR